MRSDTTSTSYFYADVEGWGSRSFFTYFSEFHRDWEGAAMLEALVLGAIFVVSLWTNAVILYAVCNHRPLRTVTNYFIANLAAADLTFAVNIPLVAVVRVTGSWTLGDVACRSLFYSQCVCGAVLIWSLALISLDRYRCIVVPPVRPRLTVRQTVYLLGAVWTSCSALFVPIAVWFKVMAIPMNDSGTVLVCTLVFPHHSSFRMSLLFLVVVLVTACVIPTAILVFNYHAIFQITLRQKQWLQTSRSEASTEMNASQVFHWNNEENPTKDSGGIRTRSHNKAIKILVMDVVLVLTMWLPLMVVICVIYADGSSVRLDDYKDEEDGHIVQSCHFFYCVLVAFANTCLNPLLYGALNDNFRRWFVIKWPHKNARNDETSARTTAAKCQLLGHRVSLTVNQPTTVSTRSEPPQGTCMHENSRSHL